MFLTLVCYPIDKIFERNSDISFTLQFGSRAAAVFWVRKFQDFWMLELVGFPIQFSWKILEQIRRLFLQWSGGAPFACRSNRRINLNIVCWIAQVGLYLEIELEFYCHLPLHRKSIQEEPNKQKKIDFQEIKNNVFIFYMAWTNWIRKLLEYSAFLQIWNMKYLLSGKQIKFCFPFGVYLVTNILEM